jgi:hypothetical protein
LIISIDVEKAFNKIQHHFMIEVLVKLGIEGMHLNINTINDKPTKLPSNSNKNSMVLAQKQI